MSRTRRMRRPRRAALQFHCSLSQPLPSTAWTPRAVARESRPRRVVRRTRAESADSVDRTVFTPSRRRRVYPSGAFTAMIRASPRCARVAPGTRPAPRAARGRPAGPLPGLPAPVAACRHGGGDDAHCPSPGTSHRGARGPGRPRGPRSAGCPRPARGAGRRVRGQRSARPASHLRHGGDRRNDPLCALRAVRLRPGAPRASDGLAARGRTPVRLADELCRVPRSGPTTMGT